MRCLAIPHLCLALGVAVGVLGGATPGTNPHPNDLPTVNEDNDGHKESPVIVQDGYTEDAPPLVYDKFSEACHKYRPDKVDWNGVVADILAFLSKPGGSLGPDNLPHKRYAAMMVRSAFHDAGSYHDGVGGADGSAFVNPHEFHRNANEAPVKFVPYVRAALWPIVEKHAISWADAIQVSGAVGAQFLGKKDAFTLKVGRCDSNQAAPNVLPAADLTYQEFVDYFHSIGLDVQDAAALMGSHVTLEDGQGHSDGVQQYTWTNKFFKDQLAGTIKVVGSNGAQTVEWSEGNWQYTVNDANDAPQNVKPDSKCPFARFYKNLIKEFANDEDAWARAYTGAYQRLGEINAVWAPAAIAIEIEPSVTLN